VHLPGPKHDQHVVIVLLVTRKVPIPEYRCSHLLGLSDLVCPYGYVASILKHAPELEYGPGQLIAKVFALFEDRNCLAE
jgi:hypothetical protein